PRVEPVQQTQGNRRGVPGLSPPSISRDSALAQTRFSCGIRRRAIVLGHHGASAACSPWSPCLCRCRGWPLRIAGWGWARCHPSHCGFTWPPPGRFFSLGRALFAGCGGFFGPAPAPWGVFWGCAPPCPVLFSGAGVGGGGCPGGGGLGGGGG